MDLWLPSSNGTITPEIQPKYFCAKEYGAVDPSTVTRWLKKFHYSYKNIDNQTRSDWTKRGAKEDQTWFITVDSDVVFQAIVANPKNTTFDSSS